MSTRLYEYQKVKKKLMPQMRRCRDRGIRTKAELILMGLKLGNVSLACKRMGVGRSSYHKWWNRLVKGNFKLQALQEKSRRPKHSPRKIDSSLERRIKYYRSKGYGPDMIRELLIREGRTRLSSSTINHVINKRRRGHVKPKGAKLKKHRRRYELPIPGQRLQIDVKYSPMKVQGQTVYVYVAVDECTRWRYAQAFLALNERWTKVFLENMKKSFPFPIQSVQTDNGHEFTLKHLPGERREHAMEAWSRVTSIPHRLIPAGVKELNGKVERSHRIDADYFYGWAPTDSLNSFNKALHKWMNYYNLKRPHGGLSYKTPLEKLKERVIKLNELCFIDQLEPIRRKFVESVKIIEKNDESESVAA